SKHAEWIGCASEAPQHLTSNRDRNGRCFRGKLPGNLLRASEKIARLSDLADQLAFQSLIGIEDAAGDRPTKRLRESNQLRQEPGAACFRHKTSAREDEADLYSLGSDTHIHRKRHSDANANGGTVDGGNRRFSAVEDGMNEAAARG